jgi:hypothetical protein
MDRQTRTGDTVLFKSREMRGRIQTLPLWLGGEGGKDDRNKIHPPIPFYEKNKGNLSNHMDRKLAPTTQRYLRIGR